MLLWGRENVKKGFNKLIRLMLAIVLFVSNFAFIPDILANDNYTHGQVINPNNEITTDNYTGTTQGDVKFTKKVSEVEPGVYDVTLSVSGVEKEVLGSTQVPIYVAVVLDRSTSMCEKYTCRQIMGNGTVVYSGKYGEAVAGAKSFANSLLADNHYPNAK